MSETLLQLSEEATSSGVNETVKKKREYLPAKDGLYFSNWSDEDCLRFIDSIKKTQKRYNPDKIIEIEDILDNLADEISHFKKMDCFDRTSEYGLLLPNDVDDFLIKATARYNTLLDYYIFRHEPTKSSITKSINPLKIL